MRLAYIYVIILAFLFASCSSPSAKKDDTTVASKAEQIIEEAIAFHGGDAYNDANIGFGFRQKMYHAHISPDGFQYSQEYTDSLGSHYRVLTNSGYTAKLNSIPLELSPKDSVSAASALNSIIYFALLPRFLSDDAVHAKLLDNETINTKEYYTIRVTFSEAGGGDDFEDVYRYWFDTEDYSMDYLAYSFWENEGGSRFRKATNVRRVNGILFQDYINYTGPSPDSLEYISGLYREGKLEKLSEIKLDRLKVIDSN